MMSDAFVHPETKEGEVFFTNSSSRQFLNMSYESKRMGNVAYDGEGRKLKTKDWFPVFISLGELEEKGLSLKEIRKITY